MVEHGVQAADVARLGRVEQRHGDAAGVQDPVERHEVLEVLRAQDRDAVADLGDLLQPRGRVGVERRSGGEFVQRGLLALDLLLGGGLGDYAPGQWSDDTEMAMCIARVAATGADLRTPDALDAVADGGAGLVEERSEIDP